MFAVQEIVLDIDEGLAIRPFPVLFSERTAAEVFIERLIAHRSCRTEAAPELQRAYEIVPASARSYPASHLR
jgi:hypothetical protein